MRCLALLVFVAVPLAAADRTHDVTPDDYFSLNAVTEIAASPDGKHVAYALATWDKADDLRKGDLWVTPTDGKGKPTKLTFDRANDRHVKWSADGKYVYFLGNRKKAAETKPPFDGITQVWRVAADGSGDVRAVTREAGGANQFDYAPFADALFFSKDKEQADDDAFAKLRAKHKVEYGHGVRKVSEIHRFDLTTWRTEKVVDDTRYVREFAVTEDGEHIAMITALDDTVVRSEGESRVDVWAKGKVTTPPTDSYRKNPKASPYAWLENLCWRPYSQFRNGASFAFTAVHDGYPTEVVRGDWTADGWKTTVLRRGDKGIHVAGYGRGVGPSIRAYGSDGWEVLGEQDGTTGIATAEGGYDLSARGGRFVIGFPAVYVKPNPLLVASPQSFPAIVIPHNETGAKDETLLDPNPHAATWKLPSVQHVIWKAPDGSTVGGVLELPPGYKKGDKLPLVVAIHGGPTTSTKADLNFDPHNGRLYLSAAGYAVLCPNYRGSTGYGDKFVTDLIGRENDIEVKDILAGIQHLVKEGIADENRVGCMGWSNGGYLTNCLITLKDSPVKFKAASSGAGIVDTVAEWGFNDEPAYPIVFKKGLPWEQPEIYRKTSPTYQLGNVTTPTLIHVGGGDERCPPGHSRMLYRALKENLKVPTELVVYGGEPHGLTKMTNRRAKMEWDLAWFGKYLKGEEK